MKSSIKIDFQDEGPKGLQPVIKVVLNKDSDDARDSLLKSFFHGLGGWSSCLHVEFLGVGHSQQEGDYQQILLRPVSIQELEEMKKTLEERIHQMKPTETIKPE